MRMLEEEGRLVTSHSAVNISGAMKIAAAARRLGIGKPQGGARRCQSAQPTKSRPTTSPQAISINNQPTSARQYTPKQRPFTATPQMSLRDSSKNTMRNDDKAEGRKDTTRDIMTSRKTSSNKIASLSYSDLDEKSNRPQVLRSALKRPASAKSDQAVTPSNSRSNCRTVMLIKNKESLALQDDIPLPQNNPEVFPPVNDEDVDNINSSGGVTQRTIDTERDDHTESQEQHMSPIDSVKLANKPKLVNSNTNSIYAIDSEPINPCDNEKMTVEEMSKQQSQLTMNGTLSGVQTHQQQLMRSESFSGDESGQNANLNLGSNSKFEERRRGLIEMESARVMALQERKSELLEKIDKVVEENPVKITDTNDIDTHKIIQMVPVLMRPGSGSLPGSRVNSASSATRGMSRRTSQRTRVDHIDLQHLTNAEAWKDINKCRYLRIKAEKIDLSGVNTLVKDQMQMFNYLKSSESSANMTERFNPIDI